MELADLVPTVLHANHLSASLILRFSSSLVRTQSKLVLWLEIIILAPPAIFHQNHWLSHNWEVFSVTRQANLMPAYCNNRSALMSTSRPPYLDSSSQNYLIVVAIKIQNRGENCWDNQGMFWIVNCQIYWWVVRGYHKNIFLRMM